MKKILIFLFLIISLFSKERYTNELIFEESPYLLQHSHNPVNWYAWGEKAFKKAKKEHKPIFLSIGYSTCHWCHVMERESFENEEIAKIINENFIPIKVDKEERPDLDKYFQKIYQVIHKRGGGWPLTIILTEDLKPFFAATYLPPEDGYGVKGLKTVLPILANAYKNSKNEIEKRANSILALLKKVEDAQYVPVMLDLSIANRFINQTKEVYDNLYKGFSKRVKFPESSRIRALIDIYMITKNKDALIMAKDTLIAMAKGGIYDQVNGGFFRYTTDRKWQIPHFEKMLYTNAELIDVYTRIYKIDKNPLFKKVIKKSIDEIDNRFGYRGLYFSASDADTNGVEGGFFIYDYEKTLNYFIKNGFKKENAKRVLRYFGIEEDGNIDGDFSNPYINDNIKISTDEKKRALKLLKKLREKRDYPFIDKKIITSWNAMYIDAKLNAFYLDKRYKDEALKSLDILMKTLYKDDILYHYFIPPNPPNQKSLLEDYAFLIKALISAYKYTLDKRYINFAKKFTKEAKERFFIKNRWYLSDEEIKSRADFNDGYYTSALSVMIHNFLSLASLTSNLDYLKDANYLINKNSALFYHSPASFPEAIRAVIRIKVGDIIIKSKKENLLNNLKYILDIKYPFIFVKKDNIDRYLACKIDTCFANSNDLKSIKETIENVTFVSKDSKWRKEVDER